MSITPKLEFNFRSLFLGRALVRISGFHDLQEHKIGYDTFLHLFFDEMPIYLHMLSSIMLHEVLLVEG